MAKIMLDMQNDDNKESVGCIKVNEGVVRNPLSKYFVPPQMVKEANYKNYFSGVGYITSGKLALEMAAKMNDLDLIPLDDCFIGKLINHIGKECL